MKHFKLMLSLMLMAMALILASCSGGSAPVNPDIASAQVPDSFGTKLDDGNIVAAYDAVIDPEAGTFTITPTDRVGSYHFPLTQYYPNVLKITAYGWTPNFWADIKLSHPYPGSGISGFDARVIAILPANTGVSFTYPGFVAQGNNKVVLEPDAYTKLFDSLGGTIVGNTNPFKAYFKATDHRIWASTGTTTETQRWQMNLAGFGGALKYKLVVDVSTNYPAAPTPVTDNAKEPVEIKCQVGTGLTPTGGSATVTVALLDWQGQTGTLCGIEAPALFSGLVMLPYTGPGSDPNTYIFSGSITNSKGAAAGTYPVMVAGADTGTQVYTYKEFSAEVKAVTTAKVKSTGFVQKPAEDSFFDVCVQPNTYVYVVADHPATQNVGGGGEAGNARTALRYNTALGNMEVINPGGYGLAAPMPDNWEYTLQFRRMDVSDGGMLINDVGGNTLGTWIVSGTTATVGACCWQYNCGLMSTIADIADYKNTSYGTGVNCYATLNAGCSGLADWNLGFNQVDPVNYSGYNFSAAPLFVDINSVVGMQSLINSLNEVVLYSSATEGKLAIVGDCFTSAGNLVLISSTGAYGREAGNFFGGLDCAIDGNGNILTLENHGGGVYRFQKFDSALTWIYESQWQDTGNPMRMDFDKSNGKLYLLVDSGVHVCTVD